VTGTTETREACLPDKKSQKSSTREREKRERKGGVVEGNRTGLNDNYWKRGNERSEPKKPND